MEDVYNLKKKKIVIFKESCTGCWQTLVGIDSPKVLLAFDLVSDLHFK